MLINKPLWLIVGLIVFANILLIFATVIFAKGFFPYKPFIPGRNQFDATDHAAALKAPFKKVIFMVVDALRR